MRAKLLSALLLSSVTAAAMVACDDGSSSGSATPPVGTVPTPGDDGGPPTADGGVDGATLPPGTGVTVNVSIFRRPIPNVTVIFHDAAGAILSTAKTDAAGKLVSTTVPAQVTVFLTHEQAESDGSPGGALVTFTAVTAGDVLVVDAAQQPRQIFGNEVHSKYAVTLPIGPVDTAGYDIAATRYCGKNAGIGPGGPVEVDLQEACLGTQGSLLVAAENEVGVATGFTWKLGVPAPAKGTTAPVTVDRPFSAPALFKLQAVGAPAGSVKGRFMILSEGAGFEMRQPALTPDPIDGLGTSWAIPGGAFTEAIQATVAMELDPTDPVKAAAIGVVKRQPPASSMLVDLGTGMLPRITSANVTSKPGGRGATVTLVSAAPQSGADGGYVRLLFDRTSGDTAMYYGWEVVVPPGAGPETTFTTPDLPAGLMEGAENGATVYNAIFVESTLVPGYRELKSVPVLPNLMSVGIGPPLPADGTVRFSGLRYHVSYGFSDYLN